MEILGVSGSLLDGNQQYGRLWKRCGCSGGNGLLKQDGSRHDQTGQTTHPRFLRPTVPLHLLQPSDWETTLLRTLSEALEIPEKLLPHGIAPKKV
jgi:hypothetical protein